MLVRVKDTITQDWVQSGKSTMALEHITGARDKYTDGDAVKRMFCKIEKSVNGSRATMIEIFLEAPIELQTLIMGGDGRPYRSPRKRERGERDDFDRRFKQDQKWRNDGK